MLLPPPSLVHGAVREADYPLLKKLMRATFPFLPFCQVHHVGVGKIPLLGANIHWDRWLQNKFSCKFPVKEVVDPAIFLYAAQSLKPRISNPQI